MCGLCLIVPVAPILIRSRCSINGKELKKLSKNNLYFIFSGNFAIKFKTKDPTIPNSAYK